MAPCSGVGCVGHWSGGIVAKLGGYTLAGVHYRTKKAVVDAVRAEINAQPPGGYFTSRLLCDLINNYHYYWSKRRERATMFRVAPFAKGDSTTRGYEFQAFFPGSVGWQATSWRKCLTPPTFETEAKRALRQLVANDVFRFRVNNYTCASCGRTKPPLNAHHHDPAFDDIWKQVAPLFTKEDRRGWLDFCQAGQGVRDDRFTLRDDSPAVIEFLRLHRSATLIVLCLDCHRSSHSPRKTK